MSDLAQQLLTATENYAFQICRIESVAHHGRAIWMMVGPDQDRLIISAALIMALLNSAEWNYKKDSSVDVSASCDKLISSCARIGDAKSGGRFSKILQAAKENLRGGEAVRRLGCEITVTQEQAQQAMIRTSVEWTARTMDGTGYLPRYARERSHDFLLMLSAYSSFVDEWISRIDFDLMSVTSGFRTIDIEYLPPCHETYDAFIDNVAKSGMSFW